MPTENTRKFELGTPYQLAAGHRRQGHRLYFLGVEKEIPYPDGKTSGPGLIFVCGTPEGIRRREGITIVAIPSKTAQRGDGNVIDCSPSDFVSREVWDYKKALYSTDPKEQASVANIEGLLTQPLFPNTSTPSTVPDPSIFESIGQRRLAQKPGKAPQGS